MDNANVVSHKPEDIAVRQVCSADSRMRWLVGRIGPLRENPRGDVFPSLLRSIVGQQLSVHAAKAVWGRAVTACCGEVSPEAVLRLSDDELRAVGLSRPKISYLRDLSRKVISREIILAGLDSLTDDEVIEHLTQVKGIGRWTVEMLLIFTLGRPDVFPVDDLGIRRAFQWLYRLPVSTTKKEMAAYGERWRPYRTVASLYLWEAINTKLVSTTATSEGGEDSV